MNLHHHSIRSPLSIRLTTKCLGALFALSVALSIEASASHGTDPDHDWPQWLGPARNGLSTETGWTVAGKDAPLWQKDLGIGYSSFTIQAGRLYTVGFDQDLELDVIFCLDPETGEELWTHAYPAKRMAKFHHGGTLTTPTIDGEAVFMMNRVGTLLRLDAETGDVDWSKDLRREFEAELPMWGFSASPLALDDVLIVNVGSVAALSKEDGEVLWKSRDYGHAYSTPRDFELRGKPCLAVFNGQGLAILDRATGKELYLHEWKTKYDVNAATPILVGEDRLFISSGYDHGCALVRLAEDGLKVEWESKIMRNHMSGSVLIGEHLYGFDEKTLKCVDLSGKEKWEVRGTGKGSLMGADGKLIVLNGKGELIIAEATPEEFRELSRTKVLSGGEYWTKPVLVNGLIYCRNNRGEMVCRDHRGSGSAE